MKKERYNVRFGAGDTFGHELAWKRAGFEDRNALFEHVRNLPLEEKVDILIELHMFSAAQVIFKRKGEFLRRLGHKTWVEKEEVLEHIKETFKSNDRIDWVINESDIRGYWVDPKHLQADSVFGAELVTHRKEYERKK